MKLKAKHKPSFYKTEKGYIDAVYRANKSAIDKSYQNASAMLNKSAKSLFKQEIKQYKSQKIKSKRAVDIIGKTEKFTPKSERLKANALNAVKNNKNAVKIYRELTKKNQGKKYTKVWDTKNLDFVGDNTYVWNNKVKIHFVQQSGKSESTPIVSRM